MAKERKTEKPEETTSAYKRPTDAEVFKRASDSALARGDQASAVAFARLAGEELAYAESNIDNAG
jgi:hypothetical protein